MKEARDRRAMLSCKEIVICAKEITRNSVKTPKSISPMLTGVALAKPTKLRAKVV